MRRRGREGWCWRKVREVGGRNEGVNVFGGVCFSLFELLVYGLVGLGLVGCVWKYGFEWWFDGLCILLMCIAYVYCLSVNNVYCLCVLLMCLCILLISYLISPNVDITSLQRSIQHRGNLLHERPSSNPFHDSLTPFITLSMDTQITWSKEIRFNTVSITNIVCKIVITLL